jgi:hypothetical protein
MAIKIKSSVIEIKNKIRNLMNINKNRILFKKNNFEYNFNKLERFWINSHIFGANSVIDYMSGKISYKVRKKTMIDIVFLLIISIRSIILYKFNSNEWICIAFGEVIVGNNKIIHSLYLLYCSALNLVIWSFLMDYKIMKSNPILSETTFKLKYLIKNTMFNKKYKEKFYKLIKFCSLIPQMADKSVVILYSIMYAYLTYNAYTNNGINHWILILLFWLIFNIKSFIIIIRVSLSAVFLQIMYAFTCKYQFQQILDEIRELCKNYDTNGITFSQNNYL